MAERNSGKRPWLRLATLLAMAPPLFMVPVSLVMGAAWVFAIPGNPTPLEFEGFSRILNALWRYPLLAGPLSSILTWQALLSKTPSKKGILILLSSIYVIFISAGVELIAGWKQMSGS
jgi:hypothetical protein